MGGSSSSSEALGGRFWRSKKLASQDYTMHERADDASNGEVNQVVSVAHGSSTEYRTYKRRWFGLAQLTLMNIVVSWDWLTFAPVASDSAAYYNVSKSTINWISIVFFLSFVAIFPVCIAVLHRGLKLSMMVAAVLMLVGNWIRYAGSSKSGGGHIAPVMVGEILIGFSQPFVLAAPTRYSDLWFTTRGRIAATALTTLANPIGAAVGQLVNPLWVKEPGDITKMVLYVSIISTVACLPAFFLPAKPPTPVAPSAETPKLRLKDSLLVLKGSLELWLILIPFSVYVGFFNSISTLLEQIMTPYGFSDDEAGIGGAVLIVVGLVCSAISSPIIDRTKGFVATVKIFIPIIAISFFVFIWMPETRQVAGPYVILAVIGASCFCLLPVALELLTELSHPISPEVTSTTAWAGGQLFGAIFVIISDALVADSEADPPKNMKRALIFQGVVALAVTPLPLCLGLFGRKERLVLRRVRSDQEGHDGNVVTA